MAPTTPPTTAAAPPDASGASCPAPPPPPAPVEFPDGEATAMLLPLALDEALAAPVEETAAAGEDAAGTLVVVAGGEAASELVGVSDVVADDVPEPEPVPENVPDPVPVRVAVAVVEAPCEEDGAGVAGGVPEAVVVGDAVDAALGDAAQMSVMSRTRAPVNSTTATCMPLSLMPMPMMPVNCAFVPTPSARPTVVGLPAAIVVEKLLRRSARNTDEAPPPL